MNRHINKNKVAKILAPCFTPVAVDGMPKEVATSMLLAPKVRSSNRERKIWNRARFTVYESTARPIPEEQKTSVKLQSRDWQQLHTTLTRCIAGRLKAQFHMAFLTRQLGKLDNTSKDYPLRNAIIERQMKVLDLHAAGLDSLRESLENELERREKFCQHLQSLTPKTAKLLRRKLCGYSK